MKLVDHFEYGLDAPICLTWELTYACNLACVHCLSSSGRRDPRELTTDEAKAVIDELQRMQVFYVNIGGGEPTVRPDFWELVDYATGHKVGVKFSTNGVAHHARAAPRSSRRRDYVDVQISLDGATAEVNDDVRGPGSYATAIAGDGEPGRGRVRAASRSPSSDPAQRRPARRVQGDRRPLRRAAAADPAAPVRPRRGRVGRAAPDRRPSSASSTTGWSRTARTCSPVTRSSTCRPTGESLPGLNLCGAGRVVCLIDPVGDVYACPFAIHENFLAGNVRSPGGFAAVWRDSELFTELRAPQTGGACASCASSTPAGRLHGGEVLHRAAAGRAGPRVRARATASRRCCQASRHASRARGRPLPPHPTAATEPVPVTLTLTAGGTARSGRAHEEPARRVRPARPVRRSPTLELKEPD